MELEAAPPYAIAIDSLDCVLKNIRVEGPMVILQGLCAYNFQAWSIHIFVVRDGGIVHKLLKNF